MKIALILLASLLLMTSCSAMENNHKNDDQILTYENTQLRTTDSIELKNNNTIFINSTPIPSKKIKNIIVEDNHLEENLEFLCKEPRPYNSEHNENSAQYSDEWSSYSYGVLKGQISIDDALKLIEERITFTNGGVLFFQITR